MDPVLVGLGPVRRELSHGCLAQKPACLRRARELRSVAGPAQARRHLRRDADAAHKVLLLAHMPPRSSGSQAVGACCVRDRVTAPLACAAAFEFWRLRVCLAVLRHRALTETGAGHSLGRMARCRSVSVERRQQRAIDRHILHGGVVALSGCMFLPRGLENCLVRHHLPRLHKLHSRASRLLCRASWNGHS
eukprot:3763311-Rhodomonas_salina.2